MNAYGVVLENGAVRFERGFQCVRFATFGWRASPGIRGNVGRFRRITLCSRCSVRIRRQHPFQAFQIGRRFAVAQVHVSAGDEFRSGRNANLIGCAIRADG